MSKYIVTSPKFEGSMTIVFDEYDQLAKWEIDARLTSAQRAYLANNAPMTLDILTVISEASNMVLTPVPDDLSFGVFWDAYRYKVGDRKKAEKLWNLLSDEEKVEILKVIPRYLYWLSTKPNMEQVHATTFFTQKRWENDYNAKK